MDEQLQISETEVYCDHCSEKPKSSVYKKTERFVLCLSKQPFYA